MAAAGPRPRAGPERWGVPGAVPPLRVDEPPPGDPEGGPDRVRGALVPGAPGVNAARVTARAWTLGLRDALAELADVRLRWSVRPWARRRGLAPTPTRSRRHLTGSTRCWPGGRRSAWPRRGRCFRSWRRATASPQTR